MSSLSERESPSELSSSAIKASSTIENITTKSDGCVKCEGTVKCPICGSDEYCVMTSLTCTSCPSTYCAPRTNNTISGLLNNSTLNNGTNVNSNNNVSINSSNHNVTVHKIVGTVVGSVMGLIVIILIVWYSFYLRKRNALAKANNAMGQDKNFNANDIEDLEMDDLYDTDEDELDDDDEQEEEESENNNNNNIKTVSSVIPSSNTSNTMTPQQYVNELRSMKPNNNNNTMSIVGDRMSTASTVRTGASNILPIGYIPGVTSGGGTMNSNSNNHLNIVGDIRSHITLGSSILDSSMFGDDEIDTDPTLQRPRIDRRTKPSNTENSNNEKNNTSSLTTAIKGMKPKLVQINEEEEPETPKRVRDSVVSDATGTGSYILDFEMDSNTPTTTTPSVRPQPPIPAMSSSSNNNRVSRLPVITNRDDITSTILSDMITIDTKVIENISKTEDNSTTTTPNSTGDIPTTLDPFSDEHKI